MIAVIPREEDSREGKTFSSFQLSLIKKLHPLAAFYTKVKIISDRLRDQETEGKRSGAIGKPEPMYGVCFQCEDFIQALKLLGKV